MYITSGSHVKSNRANISISANDHEEAESRMCLHVDDEGTTTILVKTVHTDVVVILVGIFSRSCPAPSRNALMGRLWHTDAVPLLPYQFNLPRTWVVKSSWFPLYHAFSGSTQFSGNDKKSVWKAHCSGMWGNHGGVS